jgi:type I restriction enzyme S subunit
VETLSRIARLESGHTPSRRHPEYWGGSIPWISLGDVGSLDVREVRATVEQVTDLGIANSSARLLPTNTVVLSRTATVGKVAMLGVPMATSQDYVNFVCDPDLINPAYLYFYFRALRPYWRFIAEGGGVRTIYFPFFKELQVPVPALPMQAHIADSLRTIEDAAASAHLRVTASLREVQRIVNSCMTGDFR